MITKEQAKDAARAYAARNRTGWSETFTTIEEAQYKGETCYIVRTSNVDMEGKSWMEFEYSTPVNIYVNASTGKCFGHEYGNRGIRTGN